MRDLITIGKTLYLLNIISQGINMVWLVSLWSDSNSVGHILLVYAIVITVGLLLGRIKIFGISLGVTFVLFAGLAAGYFGFTVNTTVMHFLRDFGLILFVFFIGLQVGPSFFSSFRSGGIQLNAKPYYQLIEIKGTAFERGKRYGQRKKLSAERVADEKVLSSIRCKVEHAFHRIKVQFGYRKVRYRGLAKNTARLTMLASIANMFIGNCFENRTKVSFV